MHKCKEKAHFGSYRPRPHTAAINVCTSSSSSSCCCLIHEHSRPALGNNGLTFCPVLSGVLLPNLLLRAGRQDVRGHRVGLRHWQVKWFHRWVETRTHTFFLQRWMTLLANNRLTCRLTKTGYLRKQANGSTLESNLVKCNLKTQPCVREIAPKCGGTSVGIYISTGNTILDVVNKGLATWLTFLLLGLMTHMQSFWCRNGSSAVAYWYICHSFLLNYSKTSKKKTTKKTFLTHLWDNVFRKSHWWRSDLKDDQGDAAVKQANYLGEKSRKAVCKKKNNISSGYFTVSANSAPS